MRLPLLPLAFLLALAALPAFAQAGPVGGAGPPSGPATRPPSNAKSGPVFGDGPPATAAPPQDSEPFETVHTVPKPVPTTVLATPPVRTPKAVSPKKHAAPKKHAIPTAHRHHMKATMKKSMKSMRFMSLYSTTHTLPKPTTGAARKPSHP